MTQPLPDYRRRPTPTAAGVVPPGQPHPGEVQATEDWRRAGRLVHTALALLVGTAAAVVLGASVVLAVGAVHVLTPERPARLVPVLLAAPEVRSDLAEEMTADVEEERAAPFSDAERTGLEEAFGEVLASPEVHRELRDLRAVAGRVDGSRLAATLADELREQAAGRPPEVRLVLLEAAAEVPRTMAEEGSSADATNMMATLTQLRRIALGAAGVLALPGLVAAAVAVTVARRRALTAVLVSSGAVLLAVLALVPGRFVLERLPGPLSLPGHVLAGIGQLAGPGTMWALVLLVGVPPAVWWALRSLQSSRAGGAPAV